MHELRTYPIWDASVRWQAFLPGGNGYLTELREGGSLVSAMLSGRKLLSEKPADHVE